MEEESNKFSEKLQTFVVGLFCIWIFIGEFVCGFFILGLLYYGPLVIKTTVIAYLIFIYFIDKDTCRKGGRKSGSEWVRNWKIWKIFRSYFPHKLVKTVDLPADKNYIFAIFPHGILSIGSFASFGNNDSPFRKLFPGIRSKATAMTSHFRWPIFREMLLSWGIISVDRDSIKYCLTTSNDKNHPYNSDNFTSNAVVIMVGGIEELLHSRPRNYTLVLKKRKGFIKLAIQTGSPVVPVITFGEVDIYNQMANPIGSIYRNIQNFIKGIIGIAPIVIWGRGFLQNRFGIVPYKRPLTTVVGAPISVEQTEKPTDEQINNLHQRFCDELQNLFESQKSKYIENYENVKLVIE